MLKAIARMFEYTAFILVFTLFIIPQLLDYGNVFTIVCGIALLIPVFGFIFLTVREFKSIIGHKA